MNALDLTIEHGQTIFVIGTHVSLHAFLDELLATPRDDFRLVIANQTGCALSLADARVIEFDLNTDYRPLISHVLGTVRPLGCVFGWPRLLPVELINAFDGRLFNLHSGDLPRYRGAGGGSWQVLNGELEITAHIQQMLLALDRGPLLFGETGSFGILTPYPKDVKAAAGRAAERVAKRLAVMMRAGAQVLPQIQDEKRATYFPRLRTEENGWIDFSWSALDMERFIRAFSDPYCGAAFKYREDTYRVRRASIREQIVLHPFCTGLVVNNSEKSVDIVARDGILTYSEIVDQSGSSLPGHYFREGARFWSEPAQLRFSQGFRPKVNPLELK